MLRNEFLRSKLGPDDAPTARSSQPGATPRGRVRGISSALQGRRSPAPLQGALIDSEPRALPWAGVRRRFQRRNQVEQILSAPESFKIEQIQFTGVDGQPFIKGF